MKAVPAGSATIGLSDGPVQVLWRSKKAELDGAHLAASACVVDARDDLVRECAADGSRPVSALPPVLHKLYVARSRPGTALDEAAEHRRDLAKSRELLSRAANGASQLTFRLLVHATTTGPARPRRDTSSARSCKFRVEGHCFQLDGTVCVHYACRVVVEVLIEFRGRRLGRPR